METEPIDSASYLKMNEPVKASTNDSNTGVWCLVSEWKLFFDWWGKRDSSLNDDSEGHL